MTPESSRIISLPEDDRQPHNVDEDLVVEKSKQHRKPSSDRLLWDVQALALDVIGRAGGLVGAIGVGHGKTLVGLLAPRELSASPYFDTDINAYDTVYFTPAALRESVELEREKHAEHFEIERHVYIESYAQLSQPYEGPELLPKRDPDLIILDEAHKVTPGSTRTSRLLEYLSDNPETHLIAMSGTLTNHSVSDYAHFLEFALGPGNTPLPTEYPELNSWKRILDPESESPDYAKSYDWKRFQPIEDVYGDGVPLREVYPLDERKSRARDAYLHRFRTTPGVVKTSESALQASLRINPITDLDVPEDIETALEETEDDWLLPGGEEIDDQLSHHRAKRQLLAGFYYRWDWSIPPYDGEIDREWLYARREMRQIERDLVENGPEDLDSPYFVREAIRAGRFEDRPDIMGTWKNWKEHRDKPRPPTECVWLDDYLVADAVERARDASKGSIIWYPFKALGRRLSELGIDVYFPDDDRNPELATAAESDGVIGCSVASHRKGKNLQDEFAHNVVMIPLSSGTGWEQLLGRTHRPNQPEDDVELDVYVHADPYLDSMRRAVENARFTRDTEGSRQKLLYGDWTTPRNELF